jgi:hypothetical protein
VKKSLPDKVTTRKSGSREGESPVWQGMLLEFSLCHLWKNLGCGG